jgi:hypothetical protein
MKNSYFKLILTLGLVLSMYVVSFAQEEERNIGIAMYLKPKPGMGYEFDQALTHYTKTYRTDPKHAVRVTSITGGPNGGNNLILEPLKTWAELDEVRSYQSDASARAWQNVLKHCEEYHMSYFTLDMKKSNPLPKVLPTTKYIGYFWELDPKGNEEAFTTEFYKAVELLKQGGYHFVVTRTLSGRTTYHIQFQFENGWKDMAKNLPNYKNLFTKAYPGKGEWEKHTSILSNSTKDAYTEYRTIRNSMSTR